MSNPFRQPEKNPSSIVINIIDEEYAVDFALQWSLKYPIDRWWRDRHKVAFNSTEHRVVSFWDMRIEFEEYLIYYRNDHTPHYIPDKGNWLKEEDFIEDDSELSEEEKLFKYRKEFDSLDLDQYKD